jgi:hypothetical protein
MKLRFSIRDLAWLTLLAAILLVWWLDHRNLATRARFTVETVRSSDGEPVLLRDNKTHEGLIKEGDVWHVAKEVTQPAPRSAPAP